MKKMMDKFFNLTEMAERWNVTKQYVNKLKNNDSNFPEPVMTKGRVHLFTEEQVIQYENVKKFDRAMHTNRTERISREDSKKV